MEFTNLLPKACPPAWRRPAGWVALAGFVLYALLLIKDINACAGGSDSSGYLNHARLLASGHVHVPERAIPGLPASAAPSYLYMPLGFKPAADGMGIVPTYPAGLPLLVAAVAPLAGWDNACDVVILIHSIAGLLLVFALARSLGLEASWAAVATVMLGASPLYLNYSLQAMSDLPALVWTMAAVLAARRGSQSQERSRAAIWSLAAGAAFAMAVLIRPNNVLALAPILIALGFSVRRLFFFGAGGVPGGVFFMLHSMAAYGHLFTTGYGDTRSLFDTTVVLPTLVNYITWLPRLFTPVVLLILAIPLAWKSAARPASIVSAWAFVYLGFYCFYYNTHETWWYLRFVLPAAPALVIGGLLVARRMFAALNPQAWGAARSLAVYVGIIALVISYDTYWCRKQSALSVGHGESKYPKTAQWLLKNVPKNSVIVAMQETGAVYYYTDLTFVRWDQIEGPVAHQVTEAAAAAHDPIYAVLFPWETDDVIQKRMPGPWKQVGAVQDVTIWRLGGG